MIAALVGALALDLAVGDPPNRWHPVAWIGALIASGRRRFARGQPAALTITGGATTLVAAGVAAAAGWGIARGAAALGGAGILVEAAALKATLSLRGLVTAAHAVQAELVAGDVEAARETVGRHLVSRVTTELDAPAVASAAIESVAENLTDALAAPVLAYVVFGLPGAFAYRAINTADAMIGYHDDVLEHFGKLAARADDILNLVPARLAGCAIGIAAGAGGGAPARALRTMWRQHARTESPNAGWTMAAMAGALGVTLEKRGAYRLGEGPGPAPADIGRAVRVVAAAAALVISAAALCLWSRGAR
ncbi:MAG TPA: adenosylcobinamide-phosphate synthase CbiB [Methylomirabilota bacterium]